MRCSVLVFLVLAACATTPDPQARLAERTQQWTARVADLSSDAMEGRAAGTPGHQRAANYVIRELKRLRLKPAGTDGYLQPIAFTEQRIDYDQSSARLVNGRDETRVALRDTLLISARHALPDTIDAPIVFVGYGLHMPSVGHDDFAGVDLKDKIAVYLSGGPATVAGSTKAHARARRAELLSARGAVGAIAISTPKQMEAPWASSVRNSGQPGMFFADPSLQKVRGPYVEMSWNPAQAEQLFTGSRHRFADLAAAADASRPLPHFALGTRLAGHFVATSGAVSSMNVVARIPGSDPALSREHVVLSAHLDGLGIGNPVNDDAINNGALDNAAGVAALLDIAEQLRRQRPRRSILFAFVTGEERGLLGSRYFARRPTVPKSSIVADLNYDMALPLFPLKSVTMLGADESSLGAVAADVSVQTGLPLVADPFPDRNSFIRSDQYGFIEEGIPSAAFKFGFAPNTPEAELERAFRATRYHQPSDDMTTPIHAQDEIRLHDFIVAMAIRIANQPARPRWHEGSIFAR